MPSLISGCAYDVFISYRQNDNLPSRGHGRPAEPGWVSEFVRSLKEELLATMKEPVSVYFDANPHDGLLETHDVDESLKAKLKSALFIPIISQTYCDPKSFAWQHEFLPFLEMAGNDQFGLKTTLQNGNVASRVLPVRIHDLDESDRRLLEEKLGPLRAVDFVYKASGVNRPLTSTDKKEDNINKLLFRDQVNKVANAVKESLLAMQHPQRLIDPPGSVAGPRRRPRQRALIGASLLVLLITTIFVINWKKEDKPKNPGVKKSIAVIPFNNLSATATNEMLCNSLSEDILTRLASLHELKVPSRISSNAYKDSKKTARIIGEELGVKYILEGSVLVNGEDMKVNAMLVDTETDEIIWSKPFNRKVNDYFKLQGEVAQKVVSSLEINLTGRETAITGNDQFDLKAYEEYKKGLRLLDEGTIGLSLNNVLPFFEKALELDSTLYPAWIGIANSYIKVNMFGYVPTAEVKSKLWYALEKCRSLNDSYPPMYSSYAAAALNFNFDEPIYNFNISKALTLDANNPDIYFQQALYYAIKGQYDKSLEMFDVATELNPGERKYYYYHKGFIYYLKRQFDKSIELYSQSLELEPGYDLALWGMALTYYQMGEHQKSVDTFHRRKMGTNTNWSLPYPLVKIGKKSEALEILDYQISRSKVTFVPPAAVGHIYLALGQKEEACKWFTQQIGDGGIFWLYMIKSDPRLDAIRDEPCYKKLQTIIPL